MIEVDGANLSVEAVVRVGRRHEEVSLTRDRRVLERVARSCAYIQSAVEQAKPILGVTSGFGGMSHIAIEPSLAAELQNTILWNHKVGAGNLLPVEDVRAAMLIRANSHLIGVSGIRLELIERLVTFLNAGVTPHVREFGSIGASGDLVPLTQITGALTGADESYQVDMRGTPMSAAKALDMLGLPPLKLLPKEGLAMVNGTSVMTAMAATCIHDAQTVLRLCFAFHALAIQALKGTNQSFHSFIHDLKPHPGQLLSARRMLSLLAGSKLVRDELGQRGRPPNGELLTDRYSLRCLPQFMGPIVDGFSLIESQIMTEINSATDNPLIDADAGLDFQGGNFLGQYIGVAMDQLRYYLGLLAKHVDVQISLMVLPEFSRGLAASLVGNGSNRANMGLKGLQIAGNSIMPVIGFLGNSLADRFPVHAEQFNQNLNSLGFGGARLARQSLGTFQQYLGIALLFGVQACDLRSHLETGSHDPRGVLSPSSARLYEAVLHVIGRSGKHDRPLVWDDRDQMLDGYVEAIAQDIARDGVIPAAVAFES